MAINEITYRRRGDTSPTLDAILRDESGDPVNVQLADVQFRMRKCGESTNKVDAAATIVDGGAGHVRYSQTASDMDTAGDFEATFTVTYPDGAVETFFNSDRKLYVVITAGLK